MSMKHQSLIRATRQCSPCLSSTAIPLTFLAPAIHAATFSSSASNAARQFPDKNKQRGVSAIHRTGPRYPLTVAKYPLPEPVAREDLPPRELNPNHGLWDFFPPNREPMSTPEYDVAHGRPWSLQELRTKSWEDLHCLWWICVKERNRIATSNLERERQKAGYGEAELIDRDNVVRATQRAIKHVLRERFYAWEDARQIWLKEADERWQKDAEEKKQRASSTAEEAELQEGTEQRESSETQPQV